MDVVFDENFISPLHLPNLPCRGAVRLRSLKIQSPNTDTLSEFTFWQTLKTDFFVDSFGFKCSRAEGCLYIYKND